KRGESEKIDEHTLFRLASVSKGFAGALACMLELEGVFSLDDRVTVHYPGFRLKDSINTADLTLRHLLSHTSGLVPYAFDNLVEANEDLAGIIGRLHEVDISAPPGELYGYQNVLFSMLDPIARRATGVPYPVLLDEMIFRPLGLNDASAGPINQTQGSNVAFPHVRGREGYIPLDPHRGYYNVLPAAGINASISDMGQWLLALMGEMPGQFPDSVCSQLSTPVVYTPLKAKYTRNWKPFRERYYSLGWRVYQYRERTIVYHGGYIRGYRAEIGFCPEEMTGIAFLQNSPNGLASRSIPSFFDLFIDYEETEKMVNEVLDSAPGKVSIAE
ncbi:MAG: beta-lactamase family protein, partial [Bacteroidales bacterium]|nr:beta-lactamase family protein [Bacteroidales bacterium]